MKQGRVAGMNRAPSTQEMLLISNLVAEKPFSELSDLEVSCLATA